MSIATFGTAALGILTFLIGVLVVITFFSCLGRPDWVTPTMCVLSEPFFALVTVAFWNLIMYPDQSALWSSIKIIERVLMETRLVDVVVVMAVMFALGGLIYRARRVFKVFL